MAILLTNNYQEISRVNLDYAQLITYAKYSTQSRDNNTTTYQLKTTYYIPTQATVSFGSANAYLDDAVKTYGYTTFYRGETTVQEITRTITHNEDGSSPTKSVYSGFFASFGGGNDSRVDVVFPAIQRYAIATSGTNFTDEENPTLTFSNVGLHGLRAKILVGNTEIFSEDLPDQTVTSYTYNLTTNQRNQLRQLCTGQTMSVSLAICSVDTNDTILYTSTFDVVMSIVNAMPTFTYTFQEQNQKVIDFLGSSDATTLISNVSHPLITTTFQTYKYATASLYNIKEGVEGHIIQSYSTPNPTSPASMGIYATGTNDSGKFRIRLVDSRGFETVEVDTQRTLLLYREVKINSYSFKRQSPISSNVIFNGDFNYWGNVGNYTNTPVVKYKLDDGSWATIPSSNYSIDTTNHKLTISNYEITNILPYNQVGQFSISIEDALTSKEDTNENYGKVLQGVPTFEAGEHDFQVNGDLFVADTNRDNPVNVLEAISEATFIANTYSADEIRIGTWFGKPLYRKCQTGTKTNAEQIEITLNTSNVDTYVKVYALTPRSHTGTVAGTTNEYYNRADDYIGTYLSPPSSNKVVLRQGSNWPQVPYTYVIVVEYTKTTD